MPGKPPPRSSRKALPLAPRMVVKEVGELMPFLIAQLPHKNRNNIKTLLRDGQIVVDGRVVTQHNHSLQVGQQVEVRREKRSATNVYKGLTIVFEDEHLIVIDKQEGLLSIATHTQKTNTAYHILSSHIKKQNPANKLFIVHRLDRDTSGLMVFAKNEPVKRLLQESWQTAVEQRTYLAVTEGVLRQPAGTVQSYLQESKALVVYSSQNPGDGQLAITHYQTLKQTSRYALLKVDLETGRKNQIRVHMQDLGHPVVGDIKYGARSNPIGRLGLHAWVLSFTHPITGEALRFQTTVPRKFAGLFNE
ncbi:RluA family pseudouridine synthase [Fibrisoma montanum]|uniref:Pseudouridine synthase n=1 Tax=Fibrisoma montanum TaxID=2305895 RepID=A0A418LYT2_9BACT|nr:RluA family pseudouridine synthase [Fibrisoma montanum]RIV18426.1 RluA family pseudouridine synthase [Fibrisoma montanum]